MRSSDPKRPLMSVSFVLGATLIVYGLVQAVTRHDAAEAAPEVAIGFAAIFFAFGTHYLSKSGSHESTFPVASFVIGTLVFVCALLFAVGILIWGFSKGGSYLIAAILAALPALAVTAFGIRGLKQFSRSR